MRLASEYLSQPWLRYALLAQDLERGAVELPARATHADLHALAFHPLRRVRALLQRHFPSFLFEQSSREQP